MLLVCLIFLVPPQDEGIILRYQSFTDLLDELSTRASTSHGSKFLSAVRSALAGTYVEPVNIYRAVALAQASSNSTMGAGECCLELGEVNGLAQALLLKADTMARRRK